MFDRQMLIDEFRKLEGKLNSKTPGIRKISMSDMPPSRTRTDFNGASPSDEIVAAGLLEPGEAIAFPCRWKHRILYVTKSGRPYDDCGGYHLVKGWERRQRQRLATAGLPVQAYRVICKDKTVYVGRTK